MSFEDDVIKELAASVLSIDGPYIDISNPDKLEEQDMPLQKYQDLPEEEFPLVLLYIDGEVSELVANDRFEIAVNVDASVVYKIDPKELSIADGLSLGRKCLQQLVKRILERQTTGEACASLYLSGNVDIGASCDRGINREEKDICTVTAKFTLRHIEPPQES